MINNEIIDLEIAKGIAASLVQTNVSIAAELALTNETVASKLATTNKEMAKELARDLVQTNEDVAAKLFETNRVLTHELAAELEIINQKRFDTQRKWIITIVVVNSLMFITLLVFAFAFFNFAIIVRT